MTAQLPHYRKAPPPDFLLDVSHDVAPDVVNAVPGAGGLRSLVKRTLGASHQRIRRRRHLAHANGNSRIREEPILLSNEVQFHQISASSRRTPGMP